MTNQNVNIENARLLFKNFSGEPGKFNPPGRRNFNVVIPHDIADQMASDGWNIKYLKARDDGDEDTAILQVRVSFDNYPPRIVLINSVGKTILTEENINLLDWADIANVDLTIRPYNWEMNGRTGVTAYLKSMWVTIREDAFEAKYADVMDSAQTGIMASGEELPF